MREFLITALIALSGALPLCASADAAPKHYHVLAIRVDFPYEEPDHDTTSGRGVFDLRDYYADDADDVRADYFHPWDVPPHDRHYFENHLTALNNYWNTVSEGLVSLDFEVWPQQPDSSYTMSRRFYKYGNGRSKEQTYEKLVDLVREAFTEAERVDGSRIDFAAFDTFMVIHAGIGSETSGALNDIPSAFVSKTDFDDYIGGPVHVGTATIDNCIIVPETASGNGIGGLNGIMAQMFGHRLGLPSLSNNVDGLPAAGGWCLMDTGSMSYGYGTRGFLPTYPSMWSKIDLGWVDPVVVTADTTLMVSATHLPSGPGVVKGVKIPITADEYLLIENRRRYASRDSMATATFSDSDSSGVWISSSHYDAYIPGSGILVWHINDTIIRENRATNTINDDIYRRGIDLLEADGRQDIGAYLGFGDSRGEYTEGHDDDTFKEEGRSVLSPDTSPDSGSMWGADSGVTVTVNSETADVMSVSITFTGPMAGFPLHLGGPTSLTAFDFDDDGTDTIIASDNNQPFILEPSGPRTDLPHSGQHPVLYTDTGGNSMLYAVVNDSGGYSYNPVTKTIGSMVSIDYYSYTPHWNSADPISFTPSSTNTIAYMLGYVGTDGNNHVSVRSLGSETTQYSAVPDTLSFARLAAHKQHLAFLGNNNKLYIMNPVSKDGTWTSYDLPEGPSFGPVIADLDRDDAYETILTVGSRIYMYSPDGSLSTADIPEPAVGEPVPVDIDSDGYPEIIQCGEKQVYGFRAEGVRANGFPIQIPPGDESETICTSPLVADLDGNGRLDILVTTSAMRIVALSLDNRTLPGFPIAVRGQVASTPLLFTHNGSGGLAYVTDNGDLYAWNIGTRADIAHAPWPMERGDATRAGSLDNEDVTSETITDATFEAFCYPNPITGSTGTFRITPTGTTDCRVCVYTADGIKIFEKHLPASQVTPDVPNEIVMNATDLASGLYIAKISTRQKTILYKLGVLK